MRERTHFKHTKQSILKAVISVVLACALIPTFAWADPSISEVQAQADEAYSNLCAMQSQLDEASNEYFAALEEVQAAQDRITELEGEITQATERIAEVQDKLSTRARSMYRSDQITLVDILLGSSTFEEFANNLELLNQMNQKDANMVEESKTLRAQLEAQKTELEEQKAVAEEKAEEARIVKEEAEAVTANMQAVYSNLSDEVAEMVEAQRQAEEAAQAANASNVIASNQASYISEGSYSEPEYVAATGNAIVDRAYSYIGNAEYVWGGCSPGAFDCSGFVSYCLTGAYSRLGTTYTFLGWPQVYDPQPGDVAVNSGHCGIYIGNGQMIHCATYGVGVIIGPVQSGMTFHRW